MMILWLIVLILVASASSLYKIYTAMALGHLAKKHRVGWSVAAYLGTSTDRIIVRSIRRVAEAESSWSQTSRFSSAH